MKIYVASFNRASDGAISKLVQKMKDEKLYTKYYSAADFILAVGDRKETFDFVLERYRENIPIIHLWAGEISQGTHDEVYRHAMTLMSDIQLCTNERAFNRVYELGLATGKVMFPYIVGNVMLDNIEIDESYSLDIGPHVVVLYNPVTTSKETTLKELKHINKIIEVVGNEIIWLPPNGDKYSSLVNKYVNSPSLPREQFLGLLKRNCIAYITNSSSAYYEAQFLIEKEKIIMIGERNKNRESKFADMAIENASDNIIKIMKELK